MKSTVTVPRQNNLTRSGGGVTFRVFLFSIIIFSAFFFSANTTFAANRFWVGTAGANTNVTSSWSATTGGSSGATVPSTGDIAIFDGAGTFNTDATINATWSVAGIDIRAGYSATITQSAGITVTVGASNYSQDGGTYTATTGTTTVSGNFSISAGTFTPPTTSFTISKNLTVSGTGNLNSTNVTTTINGGGISVVAAPGGIGGIFIINKGAQSKVTISTSTIIHLGASPTTTFDVVGYGSGWFVNNGTIIVDSGLWTLVGGERRPHVARSDAEQVMPTHRPWRALQAPRGEGAHLSLPVANTTLAG